MACEYPPGVFSLERGEPKGPPPVGAEDLLHQPGTEPAAAIVE